LPSVMLRDQDRKNIASEIAASTQLAGEEGDRIEGYVDVFKCDYNPNYDKFMVQARLGDSYVNFWFGEKLERTVKIRAKIKTQRGNNTTQLNYVKIIG
jgi:hypothetical protein